MAKTIAISNNKGGVAKTASASAIAAGLSQKGFKTLMVDLDSQRNLTSNFLGEKEPKETVLSTFTEGKLPIVKITENLHILPASRSVANLETALEGKDLLRLDKAIKKVADNYDYIIIDCPPNIGAITISALNACDYLFVPINADKSSYDGLGNMAGACYQAATGIRMSGIFFTMYEGNLKITKKIENMVQKSYGTILMKSRIRKCTKVRESMAEGVDLFSYDATCTAAHDYENLIDEILTIVEAK